MTDQRSVHLRCRFGLHKWTQYKIQAEGGLGDALPLLPEEAAVLVQPVRT